MADAFERTFEHIRRRLIPRHADIKRRTVTAADGPRYLKVKATDGGQEYSVASPHTKAPGSKLVTAREGCTPGEVAIPLAPPNARGIFDPFIRNTTLPAGDPYPDGCSPLTGFNRFEDVVVLDGGSGVTWDNDTITFPSSNSNGTVAATLVTTGGECIPHGLLVFAEEFVFNEEDFQAPHRYWSIGDVRRLSNSRLRVEYTYNMSDINPLDRRGYGRFWHADLGTLVYFAHFQTVGLTGGAIEI